MSGVQALRRIVLVCESPRRLADFYERALGFTRMGTRENAQPALGDMLEIPGAQVQMVSLRLGGQYLDLIRIDPPGLRYPQGIDGPSALFQHFAMQVPDVERAVALLGQESGWQPISVGGPQRLPPASGGVTAFKFRDPEGHPLEFIAARQPDPAAGAQINHSAISVASEARSIAFYERLGLKRSGGSLNVGAEQERLDGVAGVQVAVTALNVPDAPEPHLELLCYGDRFRAATRPSRPNDGAATRLVFGVGSEHELRELLHAIDAAKAPTRFADGSVRCLVPDPDGHWLYLECAGDGTQPPVANPG